MSRRRASRPIAGNRPKGSGMDERLAELERGYGEVGPGLLVSLRPRCPNDTDAEDLLQETFVAAARCWSRLNDATSSRAWLYGVARNLAAAGVRHQRVLTWQS